MSSSISSGLATMKLKRGAYRKKAAANVLAMTTHMAETLP